MKQKDVFLQSEGDEWFSRNQKTIEARKLPDEDALLQEMLGIIPEETENTLKILEIGCGEGARLEWIKNNFNADCFGIEPSEKAVTKACTRGIDVQQGTADDLPFKNHSFDIVIIGFCLYLCDREDLFRIASEVDRVLNKSGWLMIMDFYSTEPYAKNYHHRAGIRSYKMDYQTLFSWHPDYQCMTQKIRHHSDAGYTDEPDEWIAISVIRKHQRV